MTQVPTSRTSSTLCCSSAAAVEASVRWHVHQLTMLCVLALALSQSGHGAGPLRALPWAAGSTLNHWPFPARHLHEGYAYLLTHPGTPCVFWDHWASSDSLSASVRSLLQVRLHHGLSARSKVGSPPPTSRTPHAVGSLCAFNEPSQVFIIAYEGAYGGAYCVCWRKRPLTA